MKRFVSYFFISFFLLTLAQSCKKNSNNELNTQVVSVTVKNTESFSYSLGLFGDEEGASISRQAMHYLSSSVSRESDLVNIAYKYQPAANFVGTDEVEITSARGSNGASANNRITVTTIKFTITN